MLPLASGHLRGRSRWANLTAVERGRGTSGRRGRRRVLAGLGALVAIVALAACTLPISPIALPPPGAPGIVRVVPGSVRKVCQLVGEADFERGVPTGNRTASRSGLYGTDLGIPVEYGGRLTLLFGDSVAFGNTSTRTWQEDAVGYSTDPVADDCVDLTFPLAADGWFDHATIPGVSLEGLEVPTGAFAAHGFLFAFYTTGSNVAAGTMGRSVLAVSEQGTARFRKVLDVSSDRFINISPVPVRNADLPGLPSSTGDGVLLFGSGTWRKSPMSLAWAPLDRLADKASWRWFAGVDGAGAPQWAPTEAGATNLFGPPCLGELQVTWQPALGRFVLLDNCDTPRGIHLASAPRPWGPWSEHQTVFDPWADGGYCHFMHAAQDPPCDAVNDPFRAGDWGGEYGAYLIDRYTRVEPGGDLTVFFTMSTWNPYTVELMTARLRLS